MKYKHRDFIETDLCGSVKVSTLLSAPNVPVFQYLLIFNSGSGDGGGTKESTQLASFYDGFTDRYLIYSIVNLIKFRHASISEKRKTVKLRL